ncbi:aspartate carbamoyltransferase catalytic subunit [Haliovirga abyssi]|uniref:Aspartate carbamoyltransferase n=1 Tax=Haliovirga abyssi TaxID=2996794 RepID=A0AAU9DTC4_9FUSO|nr:aspartate carbamoyltransferase catalytic subunit [Haliovirga abyssi]BDU50394.1 aspartate carbamoyltransferase [Haliovirga abyssi]
MLLKNRNLFGIKDLSVEDIMAIFEKAKEFKALSRSKIKKNSLLRGKTVVNLFFENSTRTRSSFEIAGKRLGADVINMSVSTSSIKKGESLIDTAKTLDAMKADLYVIRHSQAGAPKMFSKYVSGQVINAGDGVHEHPTQALLDGFTIYETGKKFKDLNVAIIGDILHSRVARSDIYLLKKLGANVTLVGPATLIPDEFKSFGVEIENNLDNILGKMDVINLLRIQLERQGDSLFPSLDEYHNFFGLNDERLKKMKEDAIIMHPGPMNRGVEISFDVADCKQQVILDQVENGVAIRMALLALIIEGSE